MDEQQAEQVRRDRIKMLAAQADARWAAKGSAVDAPDKQQPVQMLESRDPATGIRQTHAGREPQASPEPRPAVAEERMEEAPPQADAAPSLKTRRPMRTEPEDSPWKQQAAKGNPGEEWQPASWSPAPARRRS
jgi:NADH dehydrogenase [ubiquinone] 1 alpha subcomplex assembly factor 2